MVGGTALNLSLLSRGVGEVTKNGHERIDVVFEPQDYYNFVDDSRRIYLPPIRTTYSFETPQYSSSEPIKKPHKEIPIPKTFTTRKGALLLFSEDMAHKTRQAHHIRRSNHHLDDRASQLSRSADEIDLRTVDDLAKYILSYGGQQHQEIDDENGVYLKFVHGRRKRDYFDRQIRPGFSAKRYLSSWTKCWDDQVLEKVISKGYLTEKSLFYYNPLMPHLQRRLNDDMSHYPTPYKLMRSMLMSPGSLSGYTFYRVRPESAETIGTQDYDMYGVPPSQGPAPSIKVISTKDGVQREVTYASLDKKAQEEVLTDLLVKSAVHYAMKKQQEYFEDSLARAMDNNTIQEVPEGGRSSTTMPQFDMKNAVASLLDANKGKAVIETDFPEDKSQKSERSSSMRTKPIKHKSRHGKDRVSVRSHTSSPASDEKEYIGNVPVVQFRDGSGSPSSIPQLPHIPGAIPLTPIGETSREQTTVIQLPPIGQDSLPAFNILPPTPQHTILDSARATAGHDSLRNQVLEEAETEEEWGARGSRDPGTTAYIEDDHNRRRREDRPRKKPSHETAAGIVPSGGSHLQSSSESLGATTSVHSLPPAKLQKVQWKGSQQSVKSYGSKRGPGSQHEDGSLKGSVVFGPDGEPINVGGTIAPHPRQDHIDQFHDANIMLGKDLLSDESENDEPDEWKHNRRLPRGQRDMMRNYANRRVLGTQEPKVDLNTDQKKELVVRIMTSETEEPVFVRVQYTPSTPSDKSTEIDYTSGDIDATLSINSWSYMPRDYDAEFDGIKKASSLHSLPAMPDMSKEITILSRATEKTEPVIEAKDDSIVEVKVPPATDDTLKPMTGSEGPGTDTLQSMLQSPAVTQSVTPGGRITSILDTPFNMPEEIVPEEGEIIEPEIEEEREATPVPTPPPAPPVETQLSRTSLRRESRQSFVSEKPLLSRQTSERKLSRAPSVEGKISRSQGDSKEERRVSVMSRGASKESLLQRNLSRQSVTQEQEVPQTLQETVNGNEVEEVFEEQTDDSDGQLKVDGEQIVAPKDPTPEETTPRDPTPEEETAESPPPADEATPERADSAKSKVSEKEIVDALSDHAQQIASSILSRSSSGRVLEEDVRKAAELWMETHPVRDISRSQSVQDQSMVKEIMDQQNNRKSAGPTAGEYRELIKENLTTALSNASGLDKTEIPSDAEVSPELIQTLSKESVSPEDLEVVKDEESGKNLIRTKSQMSMAMGGVKEGHIFVPVAKNGRRASASIPNDRASNADIGEFEVINYGEKDSVVSSSEKAPSEKTPSEKTPSEKSSSAKTRSEKAPSEKTPSEKGSKTSKSQPPSIMGESIPEEEDSAKDDVSDKKSRVSFKDEVEVEDEFKKAVEELEQKSQSSLKSGKSGSPDEGKKSKASVDKATTPAPKKKEEFVVGKVDTKDEIKALYGQPDPPPADPTPPTMAKEKSPTKEPTPPPEPPAKTPPKSAEKKKPPPVVSEEKPPVKSASMAKQSVSSHSEDMETKIRPVPKVSEEKIKSASTAKQSSTSRSEEMAEIQQGFKDEIKNLFGKVPAKDKGRVDHKDELKHLFGGMSQPGTKPKSTTKGKPKKKSIPSPVKKQAPPAKPKKGKKGKKKEESPEPKVPEKPPTPPPPKEPTPPPPPPPPEPPKEEPVDYESERRKSIVQNINTNIKKAPSKESVNSELKSEESFEFNIVRDTPSPSPPPQAPSIPSVEEEPDEEEEELLEEEDDEAARLRMISNKEARAAKRAAQAEKRRQEVEKRRREREDQLRREKEEFERQQLLKAELEEERRKVEEQRRLRREQQDEERDREEREEMERLKRQKQEEERERKRKEDYQRKLEEMKKRQQEEEQRRHEEMLRKQKEEEERREAELEMLAKMEEEERLEYERKKKLEEEERLKKEEEEKRQREEEAKKAMEEARRLAEEMARKQAEMEARLKFNRNLQVEANGMKHSQDITRAFVFSYFELLQWLGLDIPEFELLKLNQY